MPILLVLFLAGSMAVAQAPVVSNRAADPSEAGYRPSDGATVSVNPPSLVWVHEPKAASYGVEWARTPGFRRAQSAEGLPFNTYAHNRTLQPGTYYWRYRYKTSSGEVSNWSEVRRFTVPKTAAAFPMPTRAEQAERVPKGHPRLFLRPEDLPRLRALAAGDPAASEPARIFRDLRAAADRLLKSEPTPEPEHMGRAGNPQMHQYWWPNRVQTERACVEAETLAFTYLMTGEKRYAEGARKWILQLAKWNPDGPTNFRLNDEAAMPILFRVPRAYDWAYDALTEDDRAAVRKMWARRGDDAYAVLRRGPHINKPYGSHNNRIWHKLAETAIAFLGEPGVPQATEWLDHAVNTFFAVYPAWADDDGGWHEGLSYQYGYMTKVIWWLDVAESALKIDGFKKPYWANVGTFSLYLGVPGTPTVGFGDLSFRPPSPGWGTVAQYFARRTGSGHWQWWGEQLKAPAEQGIIGFLHAARAAPAPKAKPPADLPSSRVFRGIGIASLHNTLLDSANDVHFLFKSSPFGRQSHGHNPHNSFHLNAYGESLLTATVYRDWHGSPFHTKWVWSTEAQNAVLVDGRGQSKTADPFGRIVDSQLSSDFDYVAGEAAAAYEGRLKRFRRSVVFAKPDVIVIFDDLEAAKPATYQFMLHALAPFRVEEQQARLIVERPKAGVVVQYLPSDVPLRLRQWDGFEPKPQTQFPNTWHVEAATAEPRQTLRMVTVIVPHKEGQAEAWTARRQDSDNATRVVVERTGRPVTITLPMNTVSTVQPLVDRGNSVRKR
jgi:hypothetical protein